MNYHPYKKSWGAPFWDKLRFHHEIGNNDTSWSVGGVGWKKKFEKKNIDKNNCTCFFLLKCKNYGSLVSVFSKKKKWPKKLSKKKFFVQKKCSKKKFVQKKRPTFSHKNE